MVSVKSKIDLYEVGIKIRIYRKQKLELKRGKVESKVLRLDFI